MGAPPVTRSDVGVELWWLPLGGGDTTGCVRVNGHIFEALVATRARRPRRDLYHSALVVHLEGVRSVIEMTFSPHSAEILATSATPRE